MYDIIVIGKGLMGAAAARYLAQAGAKTAVVGPDEPADWQAHQGVFASHYDQGRITRVLDTDAIWARLAERSIAAYEPLESDSGVRFHYPVGGLRVYETAATNPVLAVRQVAQQFEAPITETTGAELCDRLPYWSFGTDAIAFEEGAPAGYINPRSLVRAHLAVIAQKGADIVRETAVAVSQLADGFRVTTDQGQTLTSKQVLIAAGAYTNTLLPQPLQLKRKGQTILMAELSATEQKRLANMMTLIYRFSPQGDFVSIYLLPPVQYPDGRVYLKLGGHFEQETIFEGDPQQIVHWFHGDGDQVRAAALKQMLHRVLPNLEVASYQTRPCILTYTTHNYPYIGQVEKGLFVAVGGCGSSAKSSNEIGRLAAENVLNGRWVDKVLDAETFTPVFA